MNEEGRELCPYLSENKLNGDGAVDLQTIGRGNRNRVLCTPRCSQPIKENKQP